MSQHANQTNRRLHVIGTFLALLQLVMMLIIGLSLIKFLIAIVTVYGFAWVGHFFFEKNKPATFNYPLWSLQGDAKLFYETITGKRQF